MPQIPKRTTSRQLGDISLGRVQAVELPGVREQVSLQQFDSIVKSGVGLADTLIARQKEASAEKSSLVVNESTLAFKSASRQKKQEIFQRQGANAEGSFTEFKKEQSKIWDQVTADLTPEQIKLFEPIAARIGFEDNSQIAAFEAKAHNQRINANLSASSLSAKTRAFDFLTNKDKFDENIEQSIQLNDSLLERQGIDETARAEVKKNLLSSSVSEGITLMSAISHPRAEAWFEQALSDGELSTPDSIKLREALDKRKRANDDDELLVWSQTKADDLMRRHGDDKTAIYKEIQETTSGKEEVALTREANVRLSQRASQREENQRALIQKGKRIIDKSFNSTDARRQVTAIMADPKATIDTANKLDRYIKEKLEKTVGRSSSNPKALDEAYTRMNKTFAGTATPKEILDSVAMIELEYADKFSTNDLKAATKYFRENGLFGKTTYDDIFRSFSNMKSKSELDVRMNKKDMKDFADYLDYVIPKLPPDKVASPFDLKKISAEYFITSKREGEVEGFFFDHTYREAVQEGRALDWLPNLVKEEEIQTAQRLLAEENALRKRQGLPVYETSERNLSRIYKQRVLHLDSAERR